MDRRVFRMAILTIISAFILVLLIVYATNAKKINELFGWGQEKEISTEVTEGTSQEEVFTGDQIGDDLSGFLLDEDFFDETEKVPSVVVRKKTSAGNASSSGISADSDDLVGDDGIAEPDGQDGVDDAAGMAVVGQVTNPNPEYPSMYQDDATGASGYLTSVPQAPPGGFGQFIPSDQTITGTPVGTP